MQDIVGDQPKSTISSGIAVMFRSQWVFWNCSAHFLSFFMFPLGERCAAKDLLTQEVNF